MSSPVRSGSDAGWDAACYGREQREFLLTAVIGSILFPAYYLHDLLLEPAHLGTLVWVRGLGSACWLLALLQLRNARTLRAARMWFFLAVSITGPMVAYVVPRVDHYSAYLIGYSAYFWGHAGMSWPLGWSLGAMGINLAALTAAIALGPATMSTVNPVGTGLYLVVAGSFAAAACHSRRTAHLTAHVAANALAERNGELELAMARLAEAQTRLVAHEKLSALGRLLAGLSHELNNPVNVIKNNLEPVREHIAELVAVLQLSRAQPPPSEDELAAQWQQRELPWRIQDLDDALDGMSSAVSHMMHVHQDLRAFIRGDVPGVVATDLATGLHATAQLLSRRTPTEVTVRIELEPLPLITCQPSQLNQVWLNLIQNALDAIGPRGTVVISGRAGGEHLEIAVQDDGPGISPHIRQRLFEPFATTKPPGKGTGLGLAISYEIVLRHGGTLTLDEAHHPGARFVVKLPLATSASTAAAA